MEKIIDMKAYGLTDQFINQASNFNGLTVSRIVSQEKGLYRIVSKKGEKLSEISGRFRYNTHALTEYPAVGDFVMTDWNDIGGNAVIHSLLKRKSCFIRKAAGSLFDGQVVAANIDTVFICISLNKDFSLRRLERYISISWDSGATPVIVLTKADLCKDLEKNISDVYSAASGADILTTSALEENSQSYLAAKEKKFKAISKYNKTNRKR